MMERRRALDGSLPRARRAPPPPARAARRHGVRRAAAAAPATRRCRPRWPSPACCANLARDETFGPRVVPIIPDEARTFGMDALFRELKIYASQGQKYEPVDARPAALATPRRQTARSSRRASPRPASMASFIAAGTAYATRGVPMVPVLHLLFDVRLPAGRRPDLAAADAAGTRASCSAPPPGAPRCSARACSTRTATACVLASTVPDRARPTTRRSPTRWPRSCRHGLHRMYGADGRGRRLLLPHPLQRELRRCRPMPERRRPDEHRRGPLPLAGRARGPVARRPRIAVLRAGAAARPAQAARRAGRALRRRRRAVVGHVVQGAARGGARRRALEPPAPEPAGPHAARRPQLLGRRAAGRSSPSPTS